MDENPLSHEEGETEEGETEEGHVERKLIISGGPLYRRMEDTEVVDRPRFLVDHRTEEPGEEGKSTLAQISSEELLGEKISDDDGKKEELEETVETMEEEPNENAEDLLGISEEGIVALERKVEEPEILAADRIFLLMRQEFRSQKLSKPYIFTVFSTTGYAHCF